MTTTHGFRVVGSSSNERRLVEHDRAWAAYARADVPGGCAVEAYLSAFRFGDDFATYLRTHGTPKGFVGVTGSHWLHFDIDRAPRACPGDDEAAGAIPQAIADARVLATHCCDAFALDASALLIAFSGAKGFHVSLPLGGFNPLPGVLFHSTCRRLAESIAADAGVTIDTAIFDRVRLLRAFNSRHPRTGLYKVRLSFDELMTLDAQAVVAMASAPRPFDPLALGDPACGPELPAAWNEAMQAVEQEHQARANTKRSGTGSTTLNRSTLAFIRDGAGVGDRHRLLYSAAANLGELGAGFELAHALLSESALDAGLPPAEVSRVIRCALERPAPPTSATQANANAADRSNTAPPAPPPWRASGATQGGDE